MIYIIKTKKICSINHSNEDKYHQIFINNKNKNLNLPEINHPFFSLVYYF